MNGYTKYKEPIRPPVWYSGKYGGVKQVRVNLSEIVNSVPCQETEITIVYTVQMNDGDFKYPKDFEDTILIKGIPENTDLNISEEWLREKGVIFNAQG
jgi:hypothetical protein